MNASIGISWAAHASTREAISEMGEMDMLQLNLDSMSEMGQMESLRLQSSSRYVDSAQSNLIQNVGK